MILLTYLLFQLYESLLGFVFLIGFVILAILFYSLGKHRLQKDDYKQDILKFELHLLEKAKNKYFESLQELKSEPTNADLKQDTLSLGRAYSELTRKQQGQNGVVTIYDEIALMNDINAVCAAATVVSNEKSVTSQSVEERLERLSELKDKNVISQQEYEAKRQKILDEI